MIEGIILVLLICLICWSIFLYIDYCNLKDDYEFGNKVMHEYRDSYRHEMKKRIDAEEKYEKLLSNFQGYVEKYKLKDQGDKDDK